MNFVPAVAYHFCLNLPEKFSQPGNGDLAQHCNHATYHKFYYLHFLKCLQSERGHWEGAGFHDLQDRRRGRRNRSLAEVRSLSSLGFDLCNLQGWPKRWTPGLVNFITALAYHFCLDLPAAFTQPRDHLIAEPRTILGTAHLAFIKCWHFWFCYMQSIIYALILWFFLKVEQEVLFEVVWLQSQDLRHMWLVPS